MTHQPVCVLVVSLLKERFFIPKFDSKKKKSLVSQDQTSKILEKKHNINQKT